MSQYIYFITENEDTNFFSTSFDLVHKDGERYFDIYNFDTNFNFDLLRYVSTDETNPHSWNSLGGSNRYKNGNGIKFYLTEFVNIDTDRNTLRIKILKDELNMDLNQYKREIRIEKLLE